MSGTQRTLSGEEADAERERPGTLVYCPACDDRLLRREFRRHEHTNQYGKVIAEFVDADDSDDAELEADEEDEEEADDPERVGGMYEIELSYNGEFRFRIPAWSEHEPKDRAKDLVEYPSNCADMFQVHSRDREITEIMSDDPAIPADWDPYGSTRLWEMYGQDEE